MKSFLISILLIFTNACIAFVEIDSAAPNFELLDTYGNEISLGSFKGKKNLDIRDLFLDLERLQSLCSLMAVKQRLEL